MGATDECRHGGLRRKCEACDMEEQLAASQERVRELEREKRALGEQLSASGRMTMRMTRSFSEAQARAETAERERDEALEATQRRAAMERDRYLKAMEHSDALERELDRLRSRYTCVRESGAICPCQSCMYERATRFERERDEAQRTSVIYWDAYMGAIGERDEARKIAYVPGCWVCDTCDLVLVRQSFDPTTGEVGIAQIEDVPVCPNGEDHGTMRRQSWREHAEALEDSVESVCDERNEARRERDEAVARAEKAIDLLSQWNENDNDGLGPDGDLLADTAELIDATRPEPARSDAGGEELK